MKRVAIIGAGISGLFIANLFKNTTGYKITIYEKNNLVNINDGYGVQLSINSVKLLNKIGFEKLDNSQKFCPKKIDFYTNNNTNKICDLDISQFNSENCKYTTLKRSNLINFLISDVEDLIKTNFSISKIDQQNNNIELSFENGKKEEYDYLIISDGVFSKSKSLMSNNKIKPKYDGTLAIRGNLPCVPNNINDNNISLFLDSNFHHVIYPVNSKGDLNFIAIIKHNLPEKDQRDYSLFNSNSFKKTILDKSPSSVKKILNNLIDVKIFPVFVSNDFYKSKNNKIHLIGDAFYAFPPSFAQGASQSIESSYELFESIKNKSNNNFFKERVKKTKMVKNRSRFNQFSFHLKNPLSIFIRNFFLKRLVKNKSFLESYLGKIYRY